MYKEALYFFNDLILIGLCLLIWSLRVFRVKYIKNWSLRPTAMTPDWEILLVEFELHRIWSIIVADISDAREISDKLSEAEQLQNFGIFVI